MSDNLSHSIMFQCADCAESYPEGSCYPASEVWVLDSRVICDNCFYDGYSRFGLPGARRPDIRILAPGQLDPYTIERCAEVAESYRHIEDKIEASIPWFARGVAAAIRALKE